MSRFARSGAVLTVTSLNGPNGCPDILLDFLKVGDDLLRIRARLLYRGSRQEVLTRNCLVLEIFKDVGKFTTPSHSAFAVHLPHTIAVLSAPHRGAIS